MALPALAPSPAPCHPLCFCSGEPQDLRPLSRADFEKVFAQFTPPSRAAQEVRRRTAAAGGAGGNGSAASATDMQLTMLVEALRQVLGPDGR